MTTDEALQVKAEAIFLRAYYHLQLAMIYEHVPYISETVSFEMETITFVIQSQYGPRLKQTFNLQQIIYSLPSRMPEEQTAGQQNPFWQSVYV